MKKGFDNAKYLQMQSQHIRERIAQFDNKLYLEFGGKLFDDYHASRVLPGFEPDSKVRMLMQLKDKAEIVIAINASDIEKNKVRGDLGITYDLDVLRLIDAFRAIGLYVLRAGVIALLPEIDVRLAYENGEQKVLLSGEDVGSLIRTNEISSYASKVSAIPEVRTFLLELQRDMARKNNVIMDGRDIGTVILPDADVKIFMTASPEARIRRRYEELLASGQSVTLEEVAAAVHERDKNDSTRKVAPAIPAADAVFVDNSGTFEDTLSNVISIIEEKIK